MAGIHSNSIISDNEMKSIIEEGKVDNPEIVKSHAALTATFIQKEVTGNIVRHFLTIEGVLGLIYGLFIAEPTAWTEYQYMKLTGQTPIEGFELLVCDKQISSPPVLIKGIQKFLEAFGVYDISFLMTAEPLEAIYMYDEENDLWVAE